MIFTNVWWSQTKESYDNSRLYQPAVLKRNCVWNKRSQEEIKNISSETKQQRKQLQRFSRQKPMLFWHLHHSQWDSSFIFNLKNCEMLNLKQFKLVKFWQSIEEVMYYFFKSCNVLVNAVSQLSQKLHWWSKGINSKMSFLCWALQCYHLI